MTGFLPAGKGLTAHRQEPFQHRMIVVPVVIDAEGQPGKIGDRDIAKTRISRHGQVRIQSIAQLRFCQSKDAFQRFCGIVFLRGKL